MLGIEKMFNTSKMQGNAERHITLFGLVNFLTLTHCQDVQKQLQMAN